MNLIGKQFGRLTVVEQDLTKSKGRKYWICKCECGKEASVRTDCLRNGNTSSCGCYRRDLTRERNRKDAIDETGNRYGRLTVLRIDEESPSAIRWICQCDCGSITSVKAGALRTGSIISCGCLKSKGEAEISNILFENGIEFAKEYSFPDLVGIGGGKLRYDFAIMKNGVLQHLIEFDGEQHFDAPEDNLFAKSNVQEHDIAKDEYAAAHGIRLIRIPYTMRGTIKIDDLI